MKTFEAPKTSVPNLIVHFGYCWSSVEVDGQADKRTDGPMDGPMMQSTPTRYMQTYVYSHVHTHPSSWAESFELGSQGGLGKEWRATARIAKDARKQRRVWMDAGGGAAIRTT